MLETSSKMTSHLNFFKKKPSCYDPMISHVAQLRLARTFNLLFRKKQQQATMPQTTALKQNLISGASCNHQTYSKGEVFFLIMIILFHMYMLIFRDL